MKAFRRWFRAALVLGVAIGWVLPISAAEQVPMQAEGVSHVHSFTAWTRVEEPACTESGSEVSQCTRCGHWEKRTLDALGHTLQQHPGMLPSCTEEGWKPYETCARCGYSSFERILPLGHCEKRTIHGVSHRGYSLTAPENTLPAYVMAHEMGFSRVECDVSFTSDGVAVLLHDSTIDRTSNGTGEIRSLTYEQLLEYDFGGWKNPAYAGVRIPTFRDFIALCAALELHPYIELKPSGGCTPERVAGLVALVREQGMQGRVSWISSSEEALGYVRDADPTARLGLVRSEDATPRLIEGVRRLRTGENQVFLDLNYTFLTDSGVLRCMEAQVPLEVFTVNDPEAVLALPRYVSGVTSDWVNGEGLLSGGWITIDPPECREVGIEQLECLCCGTLLSRELPAAHRWEGGSTCVLCGVRRPEPDARQALLRQVLAE